MLVRRQCGCNAAADVLVELQSRLLEHPNGARSEAMLTAARRRMPLRLDSSRQIREDASVRAGGRPTASGWGTIYGAWWFVFVLCVSFVDWKTIGVLPYPHMGVFMHAPNVFDLVYQVPPDPNPNPNPNPNAMEWPVLGCCRLWRL